MRLIAIFIGAALLGGGVAIGYSLQASERQIVERPVPGPTKTVVKTKRVEVETRALPIPVDAPLEVRAPRNGPPRRRSLIPKRTTLVQFERIPAAAGIPPQLVVAWAKGSQDIPNGLGLLVWQLDQSADKPLWRVIFAIQEAELGCDHLQEFSGPKRLGFVCTAYKGALVGPPFAQKEERLICGVVGNFIGFNLQDLTGDGHEEIFVSEGGCGSGGATVWRVLTSSAGGMQQIYRHGAADQVLRLTKTGIHVRVAVHRKNDSHCCPSYFRKYELVWDGSRFVKTNVRLVSARS